MKLSIKFLAIVAVLFAFSLTAFAQRGDKSITPEQRAEKVTARMTEKLELDASQAARVKDLNLTFATKMKAIKAAHNGDREASRAEAKAVKEDHKLALQEVLTEEQWTKFEKHMKKRRDKRGERKGKNGK